jgi:hypothetical protein
MLARFRVELDLDTMTADMVGAWLMPTEREDVIEWLLAIGFTAEGNRWIGDENAIRWLSPKEIISKQKV